MGNDSQWISLNDLAERWHRSVHTIRTKIANKEFLYKHDYVIRYQGADVPAFKNAHLTTQGQIYFRKSAIEAYEEEHGEYKPLSERLGNISSCKTATQAHIEPTEHKSQSDPYVSKGATKPEYLDEDYKQGKFFSKELSIAIETWLAIYGPQGCISTDRRLQEKAHLPEIKKHLSKYEKKLSKEALGRVATMVNARKAGASRTE